MNGIVIQASEQSIMQVMQALISSPDDRVRAQERFADWLCSVSDVTAQVVL
jgi:hypothetical protein